MTHSRAFVSPACSSFRPERALRILLPRPRTALRATTPTAQPVVRAMVPASHAYSLMAWSVRCIRPLLQCASNRIDSPGGSKPDDCLTQATAAQRRLARTREGLASSHAVDNFAAAALTEEGV